MKQKVLFAFFLLFIIGLHAFAQPGYEEQKRRKRIEKADEERLKNHHYEDFTPSKTYTKPTAEQLKKIGESAAGQAWMKLLYPNYKTPEQIKAAESAAANAKVANAEWWAKNDKSFAEYMSRMKRVQATTNALASAGFVFNIRVPQNLYVPFLETLSASLPGGTKPNPELATMMNFAITQVVKAKNSFNKNKHTYSEQQLTQLIADYTPFYATALTDLDTLALRFGDTKTIDSLRIVAFFYGRGLNDYSVFPPQKNGDISENWRMIQVIPKIYRRNHDLLMDQFYYYYQAPYNFDFNAQNIALQCKPSTYRDFKQALRKMKPSDKEILSAWLQIRDEMWSMTKPSPKAEKR